MAISQTNYVDITSAVAGASATGSPSLQHRRITTGGLKDAQGNPVPPGGMITVTYGMLDSLNAILDSSDDRAFAQQYFGMKTTAPANKPSSLQFVYAGAVDYTPLSDDVYGLEEHHLNFENGGFADIKILPVDAYIASREADKNFGTFSIEGLQYETEEELTKLKNYHLSYNVLHQLYIELDSKESIDLPVYTIFKDVPMTGFILSEKEGEFKAVIPAGLIDATDFEGRNTVNQVMYRQASGMTADVDNDVDKLALDGLLVNYYGVTSVNATPLSFFQKGNLQGTVADPRDMMVAACEQWIKGKVSSDLINTLVASRIPANLDGKTRIGTIIVNGAIASALRSGAILKLKELTPLQKEVILDMSGDELAAMDVFNNGFWLDVEIRTVVVDGIEEKHAHYVLIYSKADFVRKIVGSHNLI